MEEGSRDFWLKRYAEQLAYMSLLDYRLKCGDISRLRYLEVRDSANTVLNRCYVEVMTHYRLVGSLNA